MSFEVIIRGFGYALALLALVGAAVWYGWELRERLAHKLEYFRITNRQWNEYDAQLRANHGKVPLRAEIHDLHRQSDR